MMKSLMIHMWDRSKIFLRKMGGIILAGSVVVWSLSAFPRDMAPGGGLPTPRSLQGPAQVSQGVQPGAEDSAQARESRRLAQSYMGRLGRAMEPFFAPIGIDWRGGVALLTGFVAKEIVVSTLGVLYAARDAHGSDALSRALQRSGMSALSALSMMVFVLLYLPCLATVTTIRRETGSIRWMLFSVCYSTTVAWVASFCVYQGGRLAGFA